MGQELTSNQARALEYIKGSLEEQGTPPTLRELCAYMGFNAIGSAQDIVAALKKKGFLASVNKQAARAMILTEKAKAFFNIRPLSEDDGDVFSVPMLGSVPAGNPLEAIENRIDTLRISGAMLGRPRPRPNLLFAVKTSGLSMMDAGILDGDWLVVKSQKDADPGQVVVARVAGDVTCKRLMHDLKKGWYLKPENPDFKPLYAKDNPFEIVGRVVALQRLL